MFRKNRSRWLPAFLPLFIIALPLGCSEDKTYRIATAGSGPYRDVGTILKTFLEKENSLKFEVLEKYPDNDKDEQDKEKNKNNNKREKKKLSSYVNCTLLVDKKVEFALAQNDTNISEFLKSNGRINESSIRTVLPLYPEVLFIIYRKVTLPRS